MPSFPRLPLASLALTLLLALGAGLPPAASQPTNDWVRAAGQDGREVGDDLALSGADPSKIYAIGEFAGDADFDGDGSPEVSSAGDSDVFLAKYDTSGTVDWVVSAGGNLQDIGKSVHAVPGTGEVLVTGIFNEDADFDGDGQDEIQSNGGTDAFLAKYGPNGSLIFAKAVGGPGFDVGKHVHVGPRGPGVYLTGSFSDSVDLDADGAFELEARAFSDGFVARYDTSGALQWAEAIAGTGSEQGHDLVVGAEGRDLYVSGHMEDSTRFGDQTALVGEGGQDIFTARYEAMDGDLSWARRAGGGDWDWGQSVSLAPDRGRVFVTGFFTDSADFDRDGLAELDGEGEADIFVAAYDSSGSYAWSQQAGSPMSESGQHVTTGPNGSTVFVTGEYADSADFDRSPDREAGSRGGIDVFVARYEAGSGDFRWVETAGGTDDDAGKSIVIPEGEKPYYLTGFFNGGADFDGDGADDVSAPAGAREFFLARYRISTIATSRPSAEDLPDRYALRPNYPNPFNPATTIRFRLPERAPVRIVVYDALGRKVAEPIDRPFRPGSHHVRITAENWPSGLYLYRVEMGPTSRVGKMTLAR